MASVDRILQPARSKEKKAGLVGITGYRGWHDHERISK
jgi:hypothetical protein